MNAFNSGSDPGRLTGSGWIRGNVHVCGEYLLLLISGGGRATSSGPLEGLLGLPWFSSDLFVSVCSRLSLFAPAVFFGGAGTESALTRFSSKSVC